MRTRWFGLIALTLFWLLSSTQTMANPTDGQVAAGNATISNSGDTTTINQTTDKAVINWKTFNINQGQTTQFNQPSASSIALNRVNASYGASKIMGNLFANGNVWIVNPAGIMFGPTAQVNVAGLLATTSNISDQDFMNGNYHFMQQPGFDNSAVVNQGTIKVKDGGMVALVAPGVENSGVIQANMGKVSLSAGNNFTVDFYGDKLIKFDVDNQVMAKAIDADGRTLNDAVTNSGTIIADGGKVLMTAQVAQNVVDNVINMKGYVQANSIGTRGGEIVLAGGDQGVVRVSGQMIARGNDAGTTGGKIHITGKRIALNAATIDASGYSGGGEVFIGGSAEGKGPLPNSEAIYISPDSSIKADAIVNGNGGHIVTWADNSAKIYGQLSATGGAEGGNGGFIETSSHNYFDISTVPNVAAPHGTGGTWLIDPWDLTIVPGNSSSGVTINGNEFDSTADNATLGVDLITAALLNGNVIVNTVGSSGNDAGTIVLSAILAYSTTVATTLTFSAAGSVTINTPIQPANSNSILNLVLDADVNNDNIGNLQIAASVLTNGGTLEMSGQNLNITSTGLINTTGTGGRGTVTINGKTTIGVGDAAAGNLILTNAELAKITTGTLTIATAGGLLTLGGVDDTSLSNVDHFVVESTGDSAGIVFSLAGSSFNDITATTNATIILDIANVIATGDIDFNSNILTLVNSTLVSAGGDMTLSIGGLSMDNASFLRVDPDKSMTINSTGGIGVGIGSGNVNFTTSQLSRIDAGTLTLNAGSTDTSDITVSNLSLSSFTQNILNLVLNATNNANTQVNFNGVNFIANTLTANANDAINVNDSPLSVNGNLISLNADADNNGSGALNLNQNLAVIDPSITTILSGFGINQTSNAGITVGTGNLTMNGHGGVINLLGSINNDSHTTLIQNAFSVALPAITSSSSGIVTIGVGQDVGTVTQNSGKVLTAGVLNASTSGNVTLTNTNTINSIDTVLAGGSFSFVNGGTIAITGSLDAGGAVNLTANSGTIVGTGRVTGTALNARTLGGNNSNITFNNSANNFTDVTLTAGNASPTDSTISYTDIDSFNILGITNLNSTIDLTSLNGGITQSGAISGSGSTLTVNTATGSVLNNASNVVVNYTASNSGTGNIELTNTTANLTITSGGITQAGPGDIKVINTGNLTVLNPISLTSGNLTLSALSSGRDLNVSSTLTGTSSSNVFNLNAGRNIIIPNIITTPGGTLNLSAAGGNTNQSSGGQILGGVTVTSNSVGGLILNGNGNQISKITSSNVGGNTSVVNANTPLTILGMSQTGGGNITVSNHLANGDISVAGIVVADLGTITFTADGNIAFNSGSVTAPNNINLTSLKAITQSTGTLNANTLTATAANGISLPAFNGISALNLTNTTSGDITFVNNTSALSVNTIAHQGNSNISLYNTGTMSLNTPISTTGNVSLAGNTITQTGLSTLIANALTLSNSTNTVLTHDILVNALSASNIYGDTLFNNDNTSQLTIGGVTHFGEGTINMTNLGDILLASTISVDGGDATFTSINNGTINLAVSLISSGSGSFTFNNPAQLVGDSSMNTNNANINFQHSVQGNSHNFTLNSSGGDIFFADGLGNSSAFSNLSITQAHNVTTNGAVNVNGSYSISSANNIVNNAAVSTGSFVVGSAYDITHNANLNTGSYSVGFAHNIVNNASIFTGTFKQSGGSGVTNFGSHSLHATGNVSITTFNVIGNLETPALAINTSFANMTGLVNGRSDVFGAAQIDVLNFILPQTHFFNGIDLFPYTTAGDVSHYFLNSDQLEDPFENGMADYWLVTQAEQNGCYRSSTLESDCLKLHIDSQLQ